MAESGEVLIDDSISKKSELPAPPKHMVELGRTLAERHPDWPPIKLKFYFTSHETAEDMAGMEGHFQNADIYFYEDAGGSSEKYGLQLDADSDPSKDKPGSYAKPGSANEVRNRNIFGSKKIIGHIDLRSGDPIDMFDFSYSLPDMNWGTFDEMLDSSKDRYSKSSALITQREQIMVERFLPELEELMRDHPELMKQKNINILFTLGAFHTTLYHRFKQAGIAVDRVFSRTPYIYPYSAELDREIMFGREPKRDLLAKAYLENVLAKAFMSNAPKEEWRSTDDALAYLRQITSAFDTEEIGSIYDQVKSGQLTPDATNRLLKEKGLGVLPQNSQELQELLEKQKVSEKAKVAKVKAEFQQRRQVKKSMYE